MNKESRDVILFTGQSGIKIKGILNLKLPNVASKPPVSVEDKMKRISNKSFLEILELPPRMQENLWTKAFRAIRKDELTTGSGPETYLFVTFHATYYHQLKTEFLSPVDFRELMELKDRIRMIVVFIDDCFDIYNRLMAKDEMYSYILEHTTEGHPVLQPKDALLQSIMNIATILEWREIEIAFSRKIAQLLNYVPLFIMAVKHPAWMLSRLIQAYEKQRIFYLCHPISSIRRTVSSRPSGFYDELNDFIKKVLALDNSILFIPDAIDEKRIKKDKQTGKLIPELLNGWPLPFSDDWLFTPLPFEVKDVNPLNPLNFDFHRANEEVQSAISSLLSFLLDKTSSQINSRDRSMVEQSEDGLVVYRPYWAASRPPSGMQEELKYNQDLKCDAGFVEDYDGKKRITAMINTREDLAKWRIKNLFESIKNNVTLDDRHNLELENLCEAWLNSPDMVSQFIEFAKIKSKHKEIRSLIEDVLPDDYKFKDFLVHSKTTSLQTARMLAERKEKDQRWDAIIDVIPEKELFREKFVASESDVFKISSKTEFEKDLDTFVNEIFLKNEKVKAKRRSK